ncbi:hypothetical protein NA78x_004656 [Anatilimnocola sp. NA78]|uniref:hypothetical protein n=1 Tax=Anatilimnocola sp. NA78 TaxID=3415683 RepID=UPI003CE4E63E
MSLVVTCQCGQSFSAPLQLAGQTLACPKCTRPLMVPLPRPATGPDEYVLQRPAAVVQPAYHPASASSLPITSGGLSTNVKVALGAAAACLILLSVICGVGAILFVGGRPANQPPNLGPAQFGQMPQPAFPPRPTFPPAPPPPVVGAPPSNPIASALPGGVTFTRPGYFAVAAPLGWTWTESPEKKFAGMPGRMFIAQPPNRNAEFKVRQVDIPRADNEQRLGVVEGLSAQLENMAKQVNGTNLAVSGLSNRGKIPDSFDFSFSFQLGRSRVTGGGRVIFGNKRMSMLTYTSDNSHTTQTLRAAASTYHEW